MTLPNNQKTGALGELDVERLFISWGWNVGRDRIDEGYDLFVSPDWSTYRGARFLVQVKGTAKRKGKGAIVAPVSKLRLRQYAENPLPVFIVRVLADSSLYWLHAQHWTSSNLHRLSGTGTAGVRFEALHSLSDRDVFENYLGKVLRQAPGNSDEILKLNEESLLLNSLDPRLGVKLGMKDGHREHEIFAKSEPIQTSFTFTPQQSPENLKRLEDAVDFGLPRAIDVDSFKMAGSPLFDHISENNPGKGLLSIGHSSGSSGVVRIYPGLKYSITAERLALEAEMFSGQKGLAISNESKDSIFDLIIRMTEQQEKTSLTADLSVRSTLISDGPIQHVEAFRPFAVWADQVMAQDALFMELDFRGVRAGLTASGEDVKRLFPFLYWIRTLSRLHLVSRSLDSNLTLPQECVLPHEEVKDIDLAYSLLKGERRPVQVERLELEPHQVIEEGPIARAYCTNTMSMTILDQPLGEIPVAIELLGYVIEAIPGSTKMRISKGEKAEAWIFYADHSNDESWSVELELR